MPAPVTHIMLALAVLPMLPDKNKNEFLIGTSFPDIRYLGVIERDKTHNQNPSWASIQQEASSFKAGLEFHALVDRIHDQYMAEQKVYDFISVPSRLKGNFLKFYEDRLLYEYCVDWGAVLSCFDSILREEFAFGIEIRSVKKWHEMLKWYLSEKPTMERVTTLLIGLGLALPDFGKGIFEAVAKKVVDEQLSTIIYTFYDQFPCLLVSALKVLRRPKIYY